MTTTNPVPSNDPTDLLFNAQKLDEVVSGTSQYYTDRLGASRRTVAGINAAADVVLGGLGYAPPVTYASGISMTLTTQTVEYSGEIYAPKVASLPFTTSTWATDSAKFRLIQGVAATDLAASGGSSMIGYMPAGTGAVATTVQAKLREAVSVFDFMTEAQIADVQAGTALVDVTAAVQAALNARGLIRIPAGKYRITSPLVIRGNTELVGDGPGVSIIKWYGSGSVPVIKDSSVDTISDVNLNIVLRDFEVDCNNYASTGNSGIIFYRVGNATFDNLYIHHCSGNGLRFGFSQIDSNHIRVNNCRVEYVHQGDGINGVGTDVVISGCYAYSCGDTCYAMLVDNSATTNPSAKYPQNIVYRDCVAKGEWVSGSFTGAGRQQQLGFAFGPYAVGQVIYCTIEGCTCENLYSNVWMTVFAKLKLVGNTFKAHSNLTSGGVRLDGMQNVVIKGNSFESTYASANTYYSSLLLLAQRNIYGASTFDASNLYTDITGNVFEHSSTPAVIFAADPAYAVITDAVLADNVFAGATKPVQFLPLTSSGTNIFNRIQIADNTVDGTATTFVTANGVRAQYANIRLSENVLGTVPITAGEVENFQISGGYVTTVSASDGVATTVFTLANQKTVQVEVYVNAADIKYSAIGVFVMNFGQSRIAWKSDGANCTLTLSGNNVQVTQSGIGAQTVIVKVKYIS